MRHVRVMAKARKISHGKPVYTTVHYTLTSASVHICQQTKIKEQLYSIKALNFPNTKPEVNSLKGKVSPELQYQYRIH